MKTQTQLSQQASRLLRYSYDSAKQAFADLDMARFLHHAARYADLKVKVYPGTKQPYGPGDVLNQVIQDAVFYSNL